MKLKTLFCIEKIFIIDFIFYFIYNNINDIPYS
jgi:hypothetical protein